MRQDLRLNKPLVKMKMPVEKNIAAGPLGKFEHRTVRLTQILCVYFVGNVGSGVAERDIGEVEGGDNR